LRKTGYLSNIPSSKAGPSRNPRLWDKDKIIKTRVETNKWKQGCRNKKLVVAGF
jgi:hypothetical protein